jgi:hypothetical protein
MTRPLFVLVYMNTLRRREEMNVQQAVLSSTFLMLIVLPVLNQWVEERAAALGPTGN